MRTSSLLLISVCLLSLTTFSENTVIDRIQNFKDQNLYKDNAPCIWFWWKPRHRKITTTTTPAAKTGEEIKPTTIAAPIATVEDANEDNDLSTTTTTEAADKINDVEIITTEAAETTTEIGKQDESDPIKIEQNSDATADQNVKDIEEIANSEEK